MLYDWTSTFDPSSNSFWSLIALLVFIGIMIYFKVPGMIARALDDRASAIRTELEQARRMSEEAQDLLAEYRRKLRQAEDEAAQMLSAAKDESVRLVERARENLAQQLARKEAAASRRIAQAEANALAQVRAAAAHAAAKAAERVIAENLDDEARAALFQDSLKSLEQRFGS